MLSIGGSTTRSASTIEPLARSTEDRGQLGGAVRRKQALKPVRLHVVEVVVDGAGDSFGIVTVHHDLDVKGFARARHSTAIGRASSTGRRISCAHWAGG